MTSNALAEPALRLRAPALLFGPLALALFFVIGVAFAAWAGNGFGSFYPEAFAALSIAGLIGALVLGFGAGQRLWRGAIKSRRELITRAAIAGAIAGFVWPLSFGLAVALQNDVAAALSQIVTSALGLVIGAVGGALGGAAGAYLCCEQT